MREERADVHDTPSTLDTHLEAERSSSESGERVGKEPERKEE